MNENTKSSNSFDQNAFPQTSIDSLIRSQDLESDTTIKVLLVEDSEFDLDAILRTLKREGLKAQYRHVFRRDQFQEALQDGFDLIICDHKLPDFDSFEAFEILQQSGLDIPFIIISGAITEERAAQTLKRGASDFLSKHSLTRLGSSVREALSSKRLRESNRHAESELKDTQERLRIAVASTNLGTWDFQVNGEKFNACDRCRFLHQLNANGDVTLSDAIKSIHEFDRVRVNEQISLALTTGSDHDLQVEYRTEGVNENGESRWVSMRGRVYYDAKKQIERMSGIMLDVTDTKNLETRLRQAADAAEKASNAKSDFLANMSHEIRTPLGAMLGFTELLKTADIHSGEHNGYIETIARNGEDLTRLIDEILDLSKIEAGRLEIEKVQFTLFDIVGDVSSTLQARAKEKQVAILISTSGILPSFVVSDPGRLRQILMNIVGNAVKFTHKGSVTILVEMLQRPHLNPLIAFMISDTGIGIVTENQRHLFQPFQQADTSTTRRFGGTGLGLALSRRLAQALGGDVVLTESVPGEGSKFLVTIDSGVTVAQLSAQMDVTSSNRILRGNHSQPKNTAPVDLSGVKILVAEDAIDNQTLVRRLLEKKGARVEIVGDGEQAVEAALNGDHDFVMMDIQMPHLDGLQATKKLRSLGFTKAIIAFTAHAMREEQEKCAAAGCSDYLSKPINIKNFYDVMLKFKNLSRIKPS